MNSRFSNDSSIDDMHQSMQQHGYVLIENAIDTDLLKSLSDELAPHFNAGHDGHDNFMGHKTIRFGALLERSRIVQKLITHESVLALADKVLLPYCIHYHIHYTGVMHLLPGEKAQVLHRDTGIFPVLNPSPPFTMATMWALSDFTEENGGTRIVPGSHHWKDERVPEKSEVVATSMPAGSVLIYTGNVIHGGGNNESGQARSGLAIHYGLGWLRQEENQFLACSQETARALPENIQKLLGYELAAPSFGFADHVHPRDFLNGVRDPADSYVSTDEMRQKAAKLTMFSIEEGQQLRSRFYEAE